MENYKPMKFMVGPESVPDGFRAIDTAYSTFYGTKNTASSIIEPTIKV